MHRIVGLDSSTEGLRLVAIESGFRGFTVLEARGAALPAERAAGEAAGAQVKSALAGLAGSGGAGDDVVAVAMSAAQVACHLFTLPFVDPRRIEQVLPAEVEGAIPFDLSEVVWDHAVLSEEGGSTQVAVAVATKAAVREQLAVLQDAGIQPRVITFAPLALVALAEKGLLAFEAPAAAVALPEPQPAGEDGAAHPSLDGPTLVAPLPPPPTAAKVQAAEGTVLLLLEAGPGRAHCALVERNRAHLLRSLPMAGAEEWALAAQDGAACARLLQPLLRDLKLTLRGRAGQRAVPSPALVLLAGPIARLPGATEAIGAGLGLPASPLRLTSSVELPAGSLPDQEAALALGLAFRAQQPRGHINLRRGEFAFTQDLSQVRGRLARVAAAAAILLALSVGLGAAQISSLGQRAKDYDAALCAATKKVLGSCLTDYRVAVSQMSGGTSKAAGIPRLGGSDVLAEVLAHLPEAALPLLEDVEVTTASVRLKGVADSFGQVDQIRDGLKADKCFGEIKQPRVEKLRDSTKVTFSIDFPYVCAGEAGGA